MRSLARRKKKSEPRRFCSFTYQNLIYYEPENVRYAKMAEEITKQTKKKRKNNKQNPELQLAHRISNKQKMICHQCYHRTKSIIYEEIDSHTLLPWFTN